MYLVFTNTRECLEYINKKLENELYISVDIVFEDKDEYLVSNGKLLKEIEKVDGSFQNYEEEEGCEWEDKIYYKAKRNCLSIKINSRNLDIFKKIIKILSRKKIDFSIQIYE